ncbi:MAG: hypothetical protein KJS90_04615 [Acidobacteria bacterium]|nr:hypothetical protein [Acidobacteriota bacterium]
MDDDVVTFETAAHDLPDRSRTGEAEILDTDTRVDADGRPAREDGTDERRARTPDERETLGLAAAGAVGDSVDEVAVEEPLEQVRTDEEIFHDGARGG